MVLFEEFSLHIQSLLSVLDDSENLSNRPFRRSGLKRITKLLGILQRLLEHEQRFLVFSPFEMVPPDTTAQGPFALFALASADFSARSNAFMFHSNAFSGSATAIMRAASIACRSIFSIIARLNASRRRG